MDNNGYYAGIKHSNYMLPPVNYQIPFDSFPDYHQTSSQVQQPQQQQQQQQQHQLPHQVQTTHQQHHDIQSTISVKLDTINKSPSQKNDEIQACSGGYTGNNSATSANDFHGNLYHYNKNSDNNDCVASYNQASVASNYSDFDHIGGSSIGQKSLSSFLLPQQHQPHQHHSQQQNQQQIQIQHQPHNPPTAAIIGNVQNDLNQQSKVLGTFDQRTSSKCYNNKTATAPNSLQNYQQSGYKDSEMPLNMNKLPPIPQTYHHVYSYDKYSLQPRVTSHHKPYDDSTTTNRPYVCQTMPIATNHKPSSQSELFYSNSTTTEQHNRFSNRNYVIPNSAFTSPANGYFNPMYHRSNNVHRNLLPPPPLQPAIDDGSNYFHNNLLVRGASYNRSQMAFQQPHYSYGRTHHPIPIPKLQSKNEIDIMNGHPEEIYHRPYNVSYDHYDEFQFSQVPPSVTHYQPKSSKVIYAPYSSNTMSTYPPSTTHQQPAPQQQQQHNIQPQQQQQQQHHQSVIQNQVISSNDYPRYTCSNIQPSSINCANKYIQDQYSYASHPQMVYSHGTNELSQTEMPKYNQIYDKRTSTSTDKLAFVDLEEQITGSKILKTREITPSTSYDCSKNNYNKDQFIYNYNALKNSYQQMRGGAEQDASKNQSIRDYLSTWNDDEEDDGENNGKKSNQRRITAIDVMSRSCGPNKLELEGASNVSTTKIHFGIKVDNGGIPSNNLPDIIIDIEKPKVVGSDENYASVADKLYVLESIDVPFSDLNKYKHLSVVNKLPDNIVQIDRRKGDSLDDVEETLKLIEKREERNLLHKKDFEIDVKFEGDVCASPVIEGCASPIRENSRSDVGHEQDIELDPLSFHEIPVDVDHQRTVPALSPKIDQDEEISSNAQNKTADDVQEKNIKENDVPIVGEVPQPTTATLSESEIPPGAAQTSRSSGDVLKCDGPVGEVQQDDVLQDDVKKDNILQNVQKDNISEHDVQEEDDIDDEMESTHDGDGEVVRYKCVQKKVSTNDDELVHSDVSIPKLKIKIMRQKRSKSFRNRKIKNNNDSLDDDVTMKPIHVDESTGRVKTLKLICLDVINTDSFRKYLIFMKDNESRNVFQYSGPASIENNIECLDESKKDDEIIEEMVKLQEFPADLIDNNENFNDPPKVDCRVFEQQSELSSNIRELSSDERHDTLCSRELQDDQDASNNVISPSFAKKDFFPLKHAIADDSKDIHSLVNKFHTSSVDEDFTDPNSETNFETIDNINRNTDLPVGPINKTDQETKSEENQFFHVNEDKLEKNADCVDESNLTECNNNVNDNIHSPLESNIEVSDKCDESIIDSQLVANFIDNLEEVPSNPSASELMESLNDFEELIASSDNQLIPDSISLEPIVENAVNPSEHHISKPKPNVMIAESNAVVETEPMVFKSEPRRSGYTDSSSSSSCSSSDSNDSDSQNGIDSPKPPIQQQADKIPVIITTRPADDAKKVINTSSSSSDESEESDYRTGVEVSTRVNINPDSENSLMKSNFNEPNVNEPKVKIESDELPSKPDDQISHHSENDCRSCSYSGSSSDNSDESSTESDDESVPIEPNLPVEDSLFLHRKIKTEETHPCSDTTDESSSDSFDGTESEATTKDVTSISHDKSDSSSESSDDEPTSPKDSETNENIREISKTSPDSEPSEEDDKKSFSSNPSSVLSSTEKQDSFIDSITECDTCTDSVETTATPVSLTRQNSSTNSTDKYIHRSPDKSFNGPDCENRSGENYIKTEPINEDSRVFNSSPDNSDDEYVQLSPLNNNLTDDYSETQNHNRKVPQLSTTNKMVINADRNKKHALSSDGYSTSTSSSSSSSTSGSSSSSSSDDDDDSSDNDDVFEKPKALHSIDADVKSDSNLFKPMKAIKTEEEECMEEIETVEEVHAVHVKNIEEQTEQVKTVKNVEEEIIHNFDNDVILDSICVETISQNVFSTSIECAEDASFVSLDFETSEKELQDCPQLLPEQYYGHRNFENTSPINEPPLTETNLKRYKVDDKLDDGNIGVQTSQLTTQDLGLEEHTVKDIDETTEIDSVSIPDVTSIVCNSEPMASFEEEVPSDIPNSIDICNTDLSLLSNDPNVENLKENEVDIFNRDSAVSGEIHAETINDIEADTCGSSLQSNVPVKDDISTEPQTNASSIEDQCNNYVQTKEIIELETKRTDGSCNDENNLHESDVFVETSPIEEIANIDDCLTHMESNICDVGHPIDTDSKFNDEIDDLPTDKPTEINTPSDVIESTIINSLLNETSHSVLDDSLTSPSVAPKDLVYPVLDIPVKLIPLPGERFNEELYQKLIKNGEIFPSRKTEVIDNLDDFYREIPVELIPLPGEAFDEKSSRFIELKNTFFENQKRAAQLKMQENVESSLSVKNQEGTETLSQSDVDTDVRSPHSLICGNRSTLVINDSIPSLKNLCEKVLSIAGLHYEEDDQITTTIHGDDEDISYVSYYIVNDGDDFWNSTESSSPLIVYSTYEEELEDDVFIDTEISAPDNSINLTDSVVDISEKCSNISQSISIDSFTIDSHDIQYEEIVPVNRTMYKLETFKRYLQSKYIQKPNYIQIHCINKILKKYSNYQRYRTKHVQTTVQNCKKRIQNCKKLLKYPKSNEKLPNILAVDRFKVKENGQIPKNDVLRSNCDINKSKLLLLTNNNVKNKRNLNSTQRNRKLKESEVSTLSSYVSEMTKNNHLKESRAFAKEIITNKRSKSNVTITSSPIVEKSKASSPSHSSHNQIAISKRKNSESIVEPMITRNNKKRKLSFDDTLLGINRIYKQTSLFVECDKIVNKPSNKIKERPIVQSNSNILNNSKDKVKRLIIPKSKIFDGPNASTKIKTNPLVDIRLPYVKLLRNPYIDNLSKSFAKSTFKSISKK